MSNSPYGFPLLRFLSERPAAPGTEIMGSLKKSKLKFCLIILVAMTCTHVFAQTTPGVSIGTVKSISGNSIVLTPDSGDAVNVTVQDNARLLRIAPGETDLKKASPIALTEIE